MGSDAQEVPRESPGVATWPVLLTVAGFLGFVGLTLVGLRVYYLWDVREPVSTPPRSFAEPRLQADPRAERERLEAAQRKRLSGYVWIDQDRGIARIPIDDAMKLIVGRGDQAYDPLDPPADPSPVRPPERRP